ncbi:putative dynactin arp1 p62 subunit [Phaeomoniella chlamydospora]|uniref:Dynactin subunit 4 n=1 Tax=Phaeomoniella chlamydospora TaxID=158046 RepID=A0A0G2GNG2_PHACM|nr:putative dynactin arp1 p62 subunit [Phaeomoniella chlamydospora]
MWSSLDIGIKFDKPTNIRSQLDKIVNGRASKPDGAELARKSSLSRGAAAQAEGNEPSSTEELNHVARFAALKSFLKNQLATSMGSDSSTGYDTYASPSALTRIMSLYTTSGSSLRKPKSKPPLMREALTPTEGLQTGYSPNAASSTEPPPSVASDFSSTPSPDQLLAQYSATAFGNPAAKSVSSLRPMPTLLRTKRSKRCKSCKHILVKPEFKPQSTRFRIRLIALAYIPLITLRPLQPPAIPQHPLTMEAPILTPGKTSQFILNLKNHLFEPVKVTLGVPGTTPGKYGHRVTVLCPQFEIGANSEVWDDALAAPTSTSSGIAAGIGAAGEGSLMGGSGSGTMEAGKVFERGRNWVGVGVEIICAPIITVKPPPPSTPSTQQPAANATEEERPEEDPDLLEIPIRVRLEWRQTDEDPTTTTGSGGAESNRRRAGSLAAAKKKPNDGDSTATPAMGEGDEDPAKRELAYWMVVGVGRVARFL